MAGKEGAPLRRGRKEGEGWGNSITPFYKRKPARKGGGRSRVLGGSTKEEEKTSFPGERGNDALRVEESLVAENPSKEGHERKGARGSFSAMRKKRGKKKVSS